VITAIQPRRVLVVDEGLHAPGALLRGSTRYDADGGGVQNRQR
jgi:hypothetical protein